MTIDESKLEILKKVETGLLSVEEGAELLAILDGNQTHQTKEDVVIIAGTGKVSTNETRTTAVPAGWKSLWSIPLWLGIVFMGLSGYWLYSSYGSSGLGVGFWFAFFFLFLSTAIVFFGWRLIAGRWLVLNISSKKEDKTEEAKIWIPFPIHFANWALRNFGNYMPDDVKNKNYQQVIADLDSSLPDGQPFQVDIDEEGWHGEKTINVNFS
jgi:hypothetical protein